MLIEFLQQHSFLKKIIYRLGVWRSIPLVKQILPFLDQKAAILDIGCGPGNIWEILTHKGFRVTPLDIKNLSFVDGLTPKIYNGRVIPFTNKYFDTALLIFVLHHAADPEKLLKEAKRVAKEIIVIEEIYQNPAQKYLTFLWDSLINLEFIHHPHSNKTDKEWRDTFRSLGLTIVKTHHWKMRKIHSQVIYYLRS